MKIKKIACIVLALIVVLAAAGYGGYLAGRNKAEARYEAERELNVRLNRSDLDGLGEIEGTIYVTGHKSPDSDTVGSAIACAALLQQLGYDARPVVLGRVNNETQYILDAAGLEAPELMEDASGRTMILVDHSEYTQSADGLRDATIIGIIDHHNDGAITTGSQLIYDARPIGATATIMWMRYRNYGLEPDRQTALMMMGAILSDTDNLQKSTTTFADIEALKALNGIVGMADTDAFYQEMFKASLSYDGMTDAEVFFSDYKEYENSGVKYGIGCINVYDEEGGKDMAERMKAVFPTALTETGMDMLFVKISADHDDVSFSYILPYGEAAEEVLVSAVGDLTEFDGTSYVARPDFSRKKVLVPAITKVLEAHPQE